MQPFAIHYQIDDKTSIIMMKNLYTTLLFPILVLAVGPSAALAAPITFFNTISDGSTGADVTALQRLLADKGYSKQAPTGIFSIETKNALKAFQNDQGIDPSGSFDADTMASANAALQVLADTVSTTVGIESVSSPANTASVLGATMKTIIWKTSSYPQNDGVDINLIRRTSDSPISYDLVKTIARDIPDSGSFEWLPAESETGNDLYVEVTCSTESSALNGKGCAVNAEPMSL